MTAIRLAVLGPPLAGSTTLVEALAKAEPGEAHLDTFQLGCGHPLVTMTITRGDELVAVEIGRIGLVGARQVSSLSEALAVEPRVRDQIEFLRDSNGCVFVLDAQEPLTEANKNAWRLWQGRLKEAGHKLECLPILFAINKVDLVDGDPIPRLAEQLKIDASQLFSTSALSGDGVLELVHALISKVLDSLRAGSGNLDLPRASPGPLGTPSRGLDREADSTRDILVCERLRQLPLVWKRSRATSKIYSSDDGGRQLRLERGFSEYPFDYPLSGRFCLFQDDELLGSFNDWPKEWKVDGWLTTLVHLVRWSSLG